MHIASIGGIQVAINIGVVLNLYWRRHVRTNYMHVQEQTYATVRTVRDYYAHYFSMM